MNLDRSVWFTRTDARWVVVSKWEPWIEGIGDPGFHMQQWRVENTVGEAVMALDTVNAILAVAGEMPLEPYETVRFALIGSDDGLQTGKNESSQLIASLRKRIDELEAEIETKDQRLNERVRDTDIVQDLKWSLEPLAEECDAFIQLLASTRLRLGIPPDEEVASDE